MSLVKHADFRVLAARMDTAPPPTGLRKTADRWTPQYEPREGYLYVRSRAISSRVNDNFDGFPAEEIKKAYRTFVGKPVFVNHHNADHRRARGVILDAYLHEDTAPDGSPDTWVEVLMEVDAITFPKLAEAILKGRIDRTSMGTNVEISECSVCGNRATDITEFCDHIRRFKGKRVSRTNPDTGKRESVLCYEICYGLGFFENSLLVEDPADPTAAAWIDSDHTGMKVAASRKTASQAWKKVDRGYISGDVFLERAPGNQWNVYEGASLDEDGAVDYSYPDNCVEEGLRSLSEAKAAAEGLRRQAAKVDAAIKVSREDVEVNQPGLIDVIRESQRIAGKTASRTMTWAQVQATYPTYNDQHFGYGVDGLANDPSDGTPIIDSLDFVLETVNIREVRFVRYDAGDSRFDRALDGYQSGVTMTPPLLVRRAGELMTVDGNHRLSAAQAAGRTQIEAIVAQSPRTDRYTGRGAPGTVGSRTTAAVGDMSWSIIGPLPKTEWTINGLPYWDGVWIEVKPDVWYRSADVTRGEIASESIVVRREDGKWAWESVVQAFIGSPRQGRPAKGMGHTLEQAKERAEKALARDHEFSRQYAERQMEMLKRTPGSGFYEAKTAETKDPRFKGVSVDQDDEGHYVKTHRARSKSYPSEDAIPDSVVAEIERTGSRTIDIYRGISVVLDDLGVDEWTWDQVRKIPSRLNDTIMSSIRQNHGLHWTTSREVGERFSDPMSMRDQPKRAFVDSYGSVRVPVLIKGTASVSDVETDPKALERLMVQNHGWFGVDKTSEHEVTLRSGARVSVSSILAALPVDGEALAGAIYDGEGGHIDSRWTEIAGMRTVIASSLSLEDSHALTEDGEAWADKVGNAALHTEGSLGYYMREHRDMATLGADHELLKPRSLAELRWFAQEVMDRVSGWLKADLSLIPGDWSETYPPEADGTVEIKISDQPQNRHFWTVLHEIAHAQCHERGLDAFDNDHGPGFRTIFYQEMLPQYGVNLRTAGVEKTATLTPAQVEHIRDARDYCVQTGNTNFMGGPSCGYTTEIISEEDPTFEQVWGAFRRADGDQPEHVWLTMADGTIVDPTADQFGHEPIRVLRPGDPGYADYLAGVDGDDLRTASLEKTAADLMVGQGLYYRVHHLQRAFSVDDAWSAPLTISFSDDDEPRQGYSCYPTPWETWAYIALQGWTSRTMRDEIVIFSGEEVGTGLDGEPLVIPDGRVERFISWRDFLWSLSRMTGRFASGSMRGPLGSASYFSVASIALEEDPTDPVAQRIMQDAMPGPLRGHTAPGFGMLPMAASRTASTVEMLAVEDVLPLRMDKILNPDQVAKYVEDIRAGVSLPPLLIEQFPDGDRMLIDGHHRLEAAAQTGTPRVPVRVFTDRWEALKALNDVERRKTASSEVYYHGTSVRLSPGTTITPAQPLSDPDEWDATQPPRGPSSRWSDPAVAYATSSLGDAWHWAEHSWNAGRGDLPRVYRVAPLGPVFPDPNNEFAGDVVSPFGFRVLDEVTEGDDFDFWKEGSSLQEQTEPFERVSARVPFDGETIYRGLALPWSVIEHQMGMSLEEFEDADPGEVASMIVNDFDGTGAGRHWSLVYNVSYGFANENAAQMDGLPVVLEGVYRSGMEVVLDEDQLEEWNVIGDWFNEEQEVTLADSEAVEIRKVYWGTPQGRWREAVPSWGNMVSVASASEPFERTAYRGGHTPNFDGPPLHDLLQSDMVPRDVYDNPHYYTGFARDPAGRESIEVIRRARGNPDAMVTIYRSLPPDAPQEINPGDWVALSRSYAQMHGEGRGWDEWVEPKVPGTYDEGEGWVRRDGDWPVISRQVPAWQVRWAIDDLVEWGWFPDSPRVASVEAALERTAAPDRPFLDSLVYEVVQGRVLVFLTQQARDNYVSGKRTTEDSPIGRLEVEPDDGWVDKVWVSAPYRRRGLATEMVLRHLAAGYPVLHSSNTTPDGRAWQEFVMKTHNTPSREPRPWQAVAATGGSPYLPHRIGEEDADSQATLKDGTPITLRAFTKTWDDELSRDWYVKVVIAYVGDERIGHLMLTHGDIIGSVRTDPRWRRKGVATAMLGLARQMWPSLRHHNVLSQDGRAWMEAVGSRATFHPEDLRLRYVKDQPKFGGIFTMDVIEAWVGPDRVGYLEWFPDTAEIAEVKVEEGYRRNGIATKMFAAARQVEPDLKHSDILSEDGEAWMQAVGASAWQRTPGGQSYKTSIVGKNGLTYYITGSFENFSAFTERYNERLREHVKVPVGRMHLWTFPGHWEIHQVHVNADHRRQGVASAMLDLAREYHPDVVHSGPGALTDDGAAWAGAYASLRTESAKREIVVSAEGHLWTWRCSVCGEGPPNRGYRDKDKAREMGHTHAQWCWDLGWDDEVMVREAGKTAAVTWQIVERDDLAGWKSAVALDPGAGLEPDENNELLADEVGIVSYMVHPDHIEIGWRATRGWDWGNPDEDYTRRGVQTALQDWLHARYPDKDVVSDPEEMSVEAYDFWRAYTTRNPGSRWRHKTAAFYTEDQVRAVGRAAALDVRTYDGRKGERDHITQVTVGQLPVAAIKDIPGRQGEVPGEHRNRSGQAWDDFKSDVATGVREPIFIVVEETGEAYIYEGNHRRDAVVENGAQSIPGVIRFFGKSEETHPLGALR